MAAVLLHKHGSNPAMSPTGFGRIEKKKKKTGRNCCMYVLVCTDYVHTYVLYRVCNISDFTALNPALFIGLNFHTSAGGKP